LIILTKLFVKDFVLLISNYYFYLSQENFLVIFGLNFVSFTKTTIINKRKNIPSSIFYDLNNDFLKFVYNSTGNKPRLVAIDGTQVNLPYPLRLKIFRYRHINLCVLVKLVHYMISKII